MKKTIVMLILAVIVLTGCASQRSLRMQKWNIEYLTTEMLKLEIENDAYSDSLDFIRTTAIEMITKKNNEGFVMKAALMEFISITEKSIADSIAKRHGITYTLKNKEGEK